jgi:DNA-binding SARP family transcriptional activator
MGAPRPQRDPGHDDKARGPRVDVLHLSLLGGFRAHLDANPPMVLPARKAQALLAYLALPLGQAQPRDKLAALLWGDMAQPQARASLRQALTSIRRALAGGEILRVDAETVALDPAAVVADVVTFQQKVKDGTRAALEEAAGIYQGELLAGLALNEAPFEQWLLAERERLHELAVGALAKLLAQQRAAGAVEAAVESALRLLALDPLQEPAHRALMRLYAQLGRRGAALRQYQVCVAALERELRAEPEAETRALYQELLRRPPTTVDQPVLPADGRTDGPPAPAARPVAPVPEIPLLGRNAELAILDDALSRSLAGEGRLVAVLGEAGIGKSRLAAEIASIAASRRCQIMLGRCYETEQALPFAPWVDALRSGAVTERDAVVTGLAPVWRAELARLLPEVGSGGPVTRTDADPRNLFEAVVQLLHHIAADRPLVLMFEDLHWADEMSLRLLAFVGRRVSGRRTMLLATARDEDLAQAPLLGQTLAELERDQRLVRVTLAPLSREGTMALTSWLMTRGRLPADVAAIEEQVWRASEGNPFVAVETIRALRQEPGSRSDDRAVLPSRVHELIAQRLARLGPPSRQLVAVAAVVGRQCGFPLLQRAADLPELDAARAVEDLVRQRVLHQSGDGLEFTHDRIREVAQAELLGPHRVILHRRIAESLEALPADPRGADPLVVGTHYRAAQVWDKAARYLAEAGHAAWGRVAKADAAQCFQQALDALARLPDSRQKGEQAFEITFALGRVVFSTGDLGQALAHYRAAEALARTLGDDRRLSQVLGGMLYLLSSEGLHAEASELGERALALARTVDDRALQAWIGIGLGRAYFALGRYRSGIERTRWLVAMDAGTPLDASARAVTLLPSVGSRTWLALCLARIGEYGDALAAAEDAIRCAERADNGQARVWAYYTRAYIHLTRGESELALALLERALPLCRNGEVPLYYPRVLGALGYTRALQNCPAEAVELLEQAVAESRAIHLVYGYANLVTWLGVACLGTGRIDEAARLAADAVALARERGERGDEGWALRLAGDAAARRKPPEVAAAAAAYRQALDIAEALEMRPLAARTQLGLGALAAGTRNVREARAMLARASELFGQLGIARWQQEADSLSAQLTR